jgi:hypothetical protein
MIAGFVGRLFRVVARLRDTEGSPDLDRVGAELERLEKRRAQLAVTSR